jgi:predicted nicotinamide N-methyase
MASLAQLEIPGGWSERTVVVGPHSFTLLLPAEPDAFLERLEDPLATSQPHFADPYWAKLWPAAINLAAVVIRRLSALESRLQPASGPRPPEGGTPTRVLELGCGSGLVGLAALACGLEVTFSDYVPKAVELALENAARNGYPHGRGLVLDWRDPPPGDWPLILAADVTYDRTHIEPLLKTLDLMLAPDGVAWIGDSGRGPAEEFVQRARNGGWSVDLFDQQDQAMLAAGLGKFQRLELRRQARQ